MLQTKIFSDHDAFWGYAQTLVKKKLARFSPDEMLFLNTRLAIPYVPNDFDIGISYPLQNLETESVTSCYHSTHYFEPTPPRLIKYIFEHVPLKPDQIFLDVGGGIGQVSMLAALHQPALAQNICLDLNNDFLKMGKRYLGRVFFPHPVEFIYGDIFKNENYLAQADVLYHYVAFDKTGIRQLVQIWADVAKPGAIFILEDVDFRDQDLRKILGIKLKTLHNAGHHLYSHFSTFILSKE